MGTFVGTTWNPGTWNSPMNQTSFTTYCTYFKALLDGVGLVQTSDTGQLDPATVSLPGAPADAGYLIYRFSDSQQGVDPIFIKFWLGRGSSYYSAFRVRIQVGQGSNGSGTLTGTLSTAMTCGGAGYNVTASYTGTDYGYHGEGVFWFMVYGNHSGQTQPPIDWACIARTRDQTTGDFDGVGVLILDGSSNTADRSEVCYTRWGTGVLSAGGLTRHFCVPVGSATVNALGEQIAHPHFYNDNGVVKRAWATWTLSSAVLPTGTSTFNAAPYGTTRLWFTLGNSGGRCPRGLGVASASWTVAFPWE